MDRTKTFSKLLFVDVRIGTALRSVIVVTGHSEIMATAAAEFRIARLCNLGDPPAQGSLLSSHDDVSHPQTTSRHAMTDTGTPPVIPVELQQYKYVVQRFTPA